MKAQIYSAQFIQDCYKNLLQLKSELLNRMRTAQQEFGGFEKLAGDEMDQTATVQNEHQFLVNQDRIRNHILEVELALARIHRGEFGICEETEEPIEENRLRAIPFTRLSVEGAEIREARAKKTARL